MVQTWSVIPAAIAGVIGHQQRAAPLPRVGSGVQAVLQAVVWHDQSALHRCTVPPRTGSILIDLDDPPSCTQGIAFGQHTDRGVEKRWRGVQFKISCAGVQGDAPSTRTAQRLFLPTRRAIFDQQPLVKWATVTGAAAIRTVERVPVHSILPY
jgi:hypothetical protein